MKNRSNSQVRGLYCIDYIVVWVLLIRGNTKTRDMELDL